MRFRSCEEALTYAFHADAARMDPRSCIGYRARSGTNPESLTRLERIADGMMVKNLCLGSLTPLGAVVIAAEFMVPTGRLAAVREGCFQHLGAAIHSVTGRPRRLMDDAVRDICGAQMHHEYGWWAEHLSVSQKTIYRWSKSRLPSDNSAAYVWSRWRGPCIATISAVLSAAGLLSENSWQPVDSKPDRC